MEFVQIVEFDTDQPDEVQRLSERWKPDGQPSGIGPQRVTLVRDRDNPGHFVTIAEFASYDDAMANNDRPETNDFAARLRDLTVGEPQFTNLDVVTRGAS